MEEDSSADLYQHIHEANQTQYDAQTVDAATQVIYVFYFQINYCIDIEIYVLVI